MTQTHFHYPSIFVSAVELLQGMLQIILFVGIPTLLIWLQFKMIASAQNNPRNLLKTLEPINDALGALFSASVVEPESLIPVKVNIDINLLTSETIPATTSKAIQAKAAIGVVFRQAYDVKEKRLKDLSLFVEVLVMTEKFINEFWSEIPSNVQIQLLEVTKLILEFFPIVGGSFNYSKPIWPVFLKLVKRPRRAIHGFFVLRKAMQKGNSQANSLEQLPVALRNFALSVQGMRHDSELRLRNPNATVGNLLEYMKTGPKWVGDDFEECFEIAVNNGVTLNLDSVFHSNRPLHVLEKWRAKNPTTID